jgi:hypothetical protein
MKGEFVVKASKLFVVGLLLSQLLGWGEIFGATAPQTTRTNSGGGVTVKVTFLDTKSSSDLRFQVVLDTHSVNLDGYDLKTSSLLRDDSGNSYLPTAVENKGSGQHRETTLSFAKIAKGSKRVELVVKDIAGVKERIFRWDLQ